MNIKLLKQLHLVYVGVTCLAFAIWGVWVMYPVKARALPLTQPALSPFAERVSGVGLVEPISESIAISNPTPGVVVEVAVKAGDQVNHGDLLYRIDDRQLRAELEKASRMLSERQVYVERLRSLPRPEEVPPAEARVKAAQALRDDAQLKLQLTESIADKGVVGREELESRRFVLAEAQARVKEAESQLALLKAGSWDRDIVISEAAVQSAQAEVQRIVTELQRLEVRSPITGQVLRVEVRVGEFAPAGRLTEPLMVIGQTDRLRVRVDVPEDMASQVRAEAKAVGMVRGRAEVEIGLKFMRFEPLVVPKRSLTGTPDERVDTRVLQVIYELEPAAVPVYVGQQMDVFIAVGDEMNHGQSGPLSPTKNPTSGEDVGS